MSGITVEQLGLTEDELRDRVVAKLVENLMSQKYSDEDGNDADGDSPFARNIRDLVLRAANVKVEALFEANVTPKVNELISGLVIQKTNSYGEPKGEPTTFVEYLIKRVEEYITETVNYSGKSRSQDSYNWAGSQTRIAWMIDQHLQYSIKTALDRSLADLNSAMAKGLAETVKLQLAEALKRLKVDVKV